MDTGLLVPDTFLFSVSSLVNAVSEITVLLYHYYTV
jgi:hypothetical protein